ncbi:hypothetical protein F5Y06DRAFT_305293 [Hypoxylon sp. FL0890]|nr:hypothetical protein F5Y06DRAFT_305293 [Hypoxylon sp. FL0890]
MAQVSLTAVNKIFWDYLPAEIRLMILEILLQDGCSLASFATVSREWQTIIERHNFAQIKLTPSCLDDFDSMLRRNRALVDCIWLCIELEEYDCTACAPEDPEGSMVSETDNELVATALEDLFEDLSAWEPNGQLLLDISVYSPSDSEHWFKYLTFEPDTPSDECGRGCVEQAIQAKAHDHKHSWVSGSRDSAPDPMAIDKLFEQIMDQGPFGTDEQEDEWWQELPAIPAVTGVLLRQQNRRRWKPKALAQMFSRLPRLREIHYEPWREWNRTFQMWTDKSYRFLFESLSSSKLQRLVIFENFNQQYPPGLRNYEPIQTPTFAVSQMVANASLKLEHLAASFMVDASYFFQAREPSWLWPKLTSLVLTSRLLTPDRSPTDINDMLQAAAETAMKMPKLETMEIWNGRVGLATLFRYQSVGARRPAVVTWRGTWGLDLEPSVIRAWEAVALEHGGDGSTIVKELLGAGSVIKSHGDAIHYLKISKPVIRPVSLQQIRLEHNIRGVQQRDRIPVDMTGNPS